MTSSKKVNECGHPEKDHYAKGLCNNCYHKFGRNKKPWLCSHDRLYAGGMCQNCYVNNYNRKRKEKLREEIKEEDLPLDLPRDQDEPLDQPGTTAPPQ
jgi:hypothetical protein